MTELRTPPQDLDAEAVLLSAVILSSDALDRVASGLRPDHFYSNSNRRVYEAVCGLSESGKSVDLAAIAGWLRDRRRLDEVGGAPYLVRLMDHIPATARVEDHAQRVVDKWRLRRLIAEASSILAEAYEKVDDVSAFVQAAEARIYAAVEHLVRTETVETAHEVMKFCVDEIAKRRRGEAPLGLSTGFRSLDRRIGGLRGGRVYVAAARPGVGKTSFLTQVSSFVAQADLKGRGVVLFSLEMPRDQLGHRLLAQDAGIDTRGVESGVLTPRQWADLTDAATRIADWPLIIDDRGAITVAEIRSSLRRSARRLEREFGVSLGLVGIDYLQLIGTHDLAKRLSPNDRLELVSGSLVNVSKEFDVPLLVLSQLNRDCEKRPNKRPQLSDLRNSGAIEQDAHTIIFLYRDDIYRKPDEQKDRTAELIVAKARGGRTGTVRLGYLEYCTRFEDNFDDDPDDEFARITAEFGNDRDDVKIRQAGDFS
jgi:replicative DNA helicase